MKTPAPSRVTRGAAALAAFLALAHTLAVAAQTPGTPPPAADGWTPFEGTWSATGHRQDLVVGGRETATVHLSGSMVLTKGEGLRKGFRAEAIGFDDGIGSGVGAMVLTDDRGDQVFCSLVGATSERGRVIFASITGGSGAYAGVSGGFSLGWQQLTKVADGRVQGLAVNVKGQYRRPEAVSAPPAGGRR